MRSRIACAIPGIAGVAAGWFLARDQLNFVPAQIAATLVLVMLLVLTVAFWPSWRDQRRRRFFRRQRRLEKITMASLLDSPRGRIIMGGWTWTWTHR